MLGERFVILEKWRSVYNWGVLQRLLDGKASLSEAKICQYEQYGDDLRRLKVAIRKYGTKAQYHRIFRDVNIGENYAHYTGAVWEQGKMCIRDRLNAAISVYNSGSCWWACPVYP